MKPLNSVLIKPAGPDCNLACSYCFYLKKAGLFSDSKIHRMSDEILEEVVKQVLFQSGSNVSFGWQGGEPTLMGLPFFEKAVDFQTRYGDGKTVGNGLQTNGILIDPKWANFLKQYNFLVGLSLDGPEFIHNHYRLNPGKKGSWRTVYDNAKLMLDAGVEVNALTVVTDYSVQYPGEIYQFFKQSGLTFIQFIPCVETDISNPGRPTPFSVSAQKYGSFLCSLFDLWRADFIDNRPTISIRYFDSLFFNYVGLQAPECTLLPECGTYVVVEHNGDIYSCDFFVEPDWKLGNIKTGVLSEMLNSERQSEFGQIKAQLPDECTNCSWLHYCYGGCPKDRLLDGQGNRLSFLCSSYKIFLEYADSFLHQLAEDWKFQQDIAKQDNRNPALKNQQNSGRNDPCPCGSGKKYKRCCGI